MYYSVDRTDDEYAVVCGDDGDVRVVRLIHFADDAKEGGVYRFVKGSFLLDEEETERRRRRIAELERELFR